MSDSPLLKDGRFRPISWNGGVVAQKLDVFGWATDTGDRGRMMQINKKDLRIDMTYQRPESAMKARRIAAKFQWAAFGTVVVSERENGTYWVLDGGHRVLACVMRPEIQNVPCLVFKGLTKAQEAEAFVFFNASRKAPTGVQVFRAQVVAGDENAKAVESVVRGVGACIDDDKRHCRCPRLLLRLLSSIGQDELTRVLHAARDAWPDEADCERFGECVILGLVGFAKALKTLGMDLDNAEVVSVLKRTPLASLKKNGRSISEMLGKSRGDGCKIALIKAWNKKRRTNLIELGI